MSGVKIRMSGMEAKDAGHFVWRYPHRISLFYVCMARIKAEMSSVNTSHARHFVQRPGKVLRNL